MVSPSSRRLIVRRGRGFFWSGASTRRSTLPIGTPAGQDTGAIAPNASLDKNKKRRRLGKCSLKLTVSTLMISRERLEFRAKGEGFLTRLQCSGFYLRSEQNFLRRAQP